MEAERKELLEFLLDHLEEGVVLLDAVGRVLEASGPALAIVQVKGGRLVSPELQGAVERALAEGFSEGVASVYLPGRRQVKYKAVRRGGEVVLLVRDVSHEARLSSLGSDLVASVSHELKTPVTGLLLLAEALVEALAARDPRAREFASRLLGEARRLKALVEDLLDLARVEKAGFRKRLLPRHEVVREAVERVSSLLAERSVRLEVRVGAGEVWGEREGLVSALANLLDNAARYSGPGSRVWLDAGSSGSWDFFAVRDEGPGIPRDEIGRIFEPFYRLDPSRSKGGTGLGLAIVKRVAEGHGGRVSVESRVGEGSVFAIHLPAARPEGREGEGTGGGGGA